MSFQEVTQIQEAILEALEKCGRGSDSELLFRRALAALDMKELPSTAEMDVHADLAEAVALLRTLPTFASDGFCHVCDRYMDHHTDCKLAVFLGRCP